MSDNLGSKIVFPVILAVTLLLGLIGASVVSGFASDAGNTIKQLCVINGIRSLNDLQPFLFYVLLTMAALGGLGLFTYTVIKNNTAGRLFSLLALLMIGVVAFNGPATPTRVAYADTQTCLLVDGSNAMQADLNMGGNDITNVATVSNIGGTLSLTNDADENVVQIASTVAGGGMNGIKVWNDGTASATGHIEIVDLGNANTGQPREAVNGMLARRSGSFIMVQNAIFNPITGWSQQDATLPTSRLEAGGGEGISLQVAAPGTDISDFNTLERFQVRWDGVEPDTRPSNYWLQAKAPLYGDRTGSSWPTGQQTDPLMWLNAGSEGDGLGESIRLDFFADSAQATQIIGRKARGTMASPTTVQNGDALARLSGRGYVTNGSNGGYPNNNAQVALRACENYTLTAQCGEVALRGMLAGTTTFGDILVANATTSAVTTDTFTLQPRNTASGAYGWRIQNPGNTNIAGSITYGSSVNTSGGMFVTGQSYANNITPLVVFGKTAAAGSSNITGIIFDAREADNTAWDGTLFAWRNNGTIVASIGQSDFNIASSHYLQASKSGSGAPTATDCDVAGELGRIYIDTTGGTEKLYVCLGAAGWKSSALS